MDNLPWVVRSRLVARVTRCVYEKVAQKVAQHIFAPNLYSTFTVEKVAQTIWATSVIYKKLHEINNRTMGQNSANLVTLIGSQSTRRRQCPNICKKIIFLKEAMK
jgi:hypothetical protein